MSLSVFFILGIWFRCTVSPFLFGCMDRPWDLFADAGFYGGARSQLEWEIK